MMHSCPHWCIDAVPIRLGHHISCEVVLSNDLHECLIYNRWRKVGILLIYSSFHSKMRPTRIFYVLSVENILWFLTRIIPIPHVPGAAIYQWVFQKHIWVFNPRAVIMSTYYEYDISECMDDISYVEFQRRPFTFPTKYFTNTLNDLFYSEVKIWELLNLRAHAQFCGVKPLIGKAALPYNNGSKAGYWRFFCYYLTAKVLVRFLD